MSGYNEIKTRFSSDEIFLESLIGVEEAAHLINVAFNEYERVVLKKHVMFEKNNRVSNKKETLLREMLPYYLASLRKLYGFDSSLQESDIKFFSDEFIRKFVFKRFVIVEKFKPNPQNVLQHNSYVSPLTIHLKQDDMSKFNEIEMEELKKILLSLE